MTEDERTSALWDQVHSLEAEVVELRAMLARCEELLKREVPA